LTKITILAAENGPLIISVDGKATEALCRCGGSGSKPKCDGTHHKNAFKAERHDLTVFDSDDASKPQGTTMG